MLWDDLNNRGSHSCSIQHVLHLVGSSIKQNEGVENAIVYVSSCIPVSVIPLIDSKNSNG